MRDYARAVRYRGYWIETDCVADDDGPVLFFDADADATEDERFELGRQRVDAWLDEGEA